MGGDLVSATHRNALVDLAPPAFVKLWRGSQKSRTTNRDLLIRIHPFAPCPSWWMLSPVSGQSLPVEAGNPKSC
jgi:hypothetical protein